MRHGKKKSQFDNERSLQETGKSTYQKYNELSLEKRQMGYSQYRDQTSQHKTGKTRGELQHAKNQMSPLDRLIQDAQSHDQNKSVIAQNQLLSVYMEMKMDQSHETAAIENLLISKGILAPKPDWA